MIVAKSVTRDGKKIIEVELDGNLGDLVKEAAIIVRNLVMNRNDGVSETDALETIITAIYKINVEASDGGIITTSHKEGMKQ
jgi:hypothetical protein